MADVQLTARGRVLAMLGGLAVLVVLCLLVEGAARVAIYWKYGNAQRGAWWTLDYEPYLLFKWDEKLKQAHAEKGDQYRIVLLGGSTAAMMPPPVLAEAFAEVVPGEVEVINLAQGGYITTQERIALALYGIPLEPDLIVTLNGYNDIINGSKTGDPSVHYWNGYIDTAVNRPFMNVVATVARKSQFVNAIVKLREQGNERLRYEDGESTKRLLEHFDESIRAFGRVAKGLDAEYIAVLQPYAQLRTTITARESGFGMIRPAQNDFVIASLKAMDARLRGPLRDEVDYFVNAASAFDATTEECFTDEAHMTELGNRLLAGHIVNGATEQGFPGKGRRVAGRPASD